jgi:hypothetical protein
MKEIIPAEAIARNILMIRGHKVMLDNALAELYNVPTKRLNEQVKRNTERFPADFAFQLSDEEWKNLTMIKSDLNRSQIATGSQKHRDPRYLPWAFTEHGAIMAATVLNSPQAVAMSVHVVRAFIKLREILSGNKELSYKLGQLERRIEKHDDEIKAIFNAIRQLISAPEPKKRKIGFRRENE